MSSSLITKAAYEKAQVQSTHKLAPRVGHYVFQRREVKSITREIEVELMETLWKPLTDSSFIEGLTFQVATHSFYCAVAIGPKHIPSTELINRVVIVKEVTVNDKTVYIKWDVLNDKPLLTKPKSLFAMNPISYDAIDRLNSNYGIRDEQRDALVYDAPEDFIVISNTLTIRITSAQRN